MKIFIFFSPIVNPVETKKLNSKTEDLKKVTELNKLNQTSVVKKQISENKDDVTDFDKELNSLMELCD